VRFLPALSLAVGPAVLRASTFAATGSAEDSDEGNTAALNRLIKTNVAKHLEFLVAPVQVARILGFFISGLRLGLRYEASFFRCAIDTQSQDSLKGRCVLNQRLHLNSSKLADRVRLTGEKLFFVE
jgi:hypothetical protein